VKIIFAEIHFDEKARYTLTKLLPFLRKHFDTFFEETEAGGNIAEKYLDEADEIRYAMEDKLKFLNS